MNLVLSRKPVCGICRTFITQDARTILRTQNSRLEKLALDFARLTMKKTAANSKALDTHTTYIVS